MSSQPSERDAQDDSHKTWVKFEDDEAGGAGLKQTEGSQQSPGASSVLSGEECTSAALKNEIAHVEKKPVLVERQSERSDRDATSGSVPTQQYSGAIINPETVHINLDRSSLNRSTTDDYQAENKLDASGRMRNVDLRDVSNGRSTSSRASNIDNSVRQGFANGDIVVTVLPVNTRWPWVAPAQFRPELVPEELMAQGLTLTVEEYVHVMEVLTNDVRFNIYNVCYKRILVVWIFTAFVVLLGLLFSGVTGLTLFGLGVMWLVLNALAIFLCMWIKIKLNHNLERCMAQVNKHLIRHKIILGLDDRGKLSCHKVNLCFIYFDTADCIKKLQEVIEREEREGRPVNREESTEERRQRQQFQQRMDIEAHDIIIQGSSTTRLSRKQERAELLLLRYSHRWAKEFVRKHLELSVDGADRSGASSGPPAGPRHCVAARCPCQFIEDHLKYKPREMLTEARKGEHVYAGANYREAKPVPPAELSKPAPPEMAGIPHPTARTSYFSFFPS